MSILTELGLDPATLLWWDLAACRNIVQEYTDEHGNRQVFDPMFDNYEDDEQPYVVRNATDRLCLSCPVQQQCFKFGVDNQETGVYGGVYLANGRVDRTRNDHKSEQTWAEIKKVLGDDVH